MQQSFVLKSGNQSDHKESIQIQAFRDELIRQIVEVLQSFQLGESQSKEEQMFYDGFKNQIIHQHLSDLLTQIQLSHSFKNLDKNLAVRILSNISNTLKSFANQRTTICIQVNSWVLSLQKETLRLIQDVYDTYQIVENTGACGRDSIIRQWDLQLRRVEQYNFFWENLPSLSNKFKPVTQENFNSISVNQTIENWINMFTLRINPKIIERKIEVPIIKSNHDPSEILLKQAHELYAGLGVDKDTSEALKIYKELASQNNPSAQAVMGQIFLEGVICEKDLTQAHQYFSNSGEYNYFAAFQAQKLILNGSLFQEEDRQFQMNQGSQEKIQNEKERIKQCQFAITVLEKLAKTYSYVPAQLFLGDFYLQGLKLGYYNLEPDYSQAEIFLKQALSSSHQAEAYYKLAKLYQKMIDIEIYKNRKNYILTFFRQAKNEDYLPAFYETGMLMLQENQEMALMIFEQGAFKGDTKCAKQLTKLKLVELINGGLSFDEYMELLDQLDEKFKTEPVTYFDRAKVYFKGYQTKKDQMKALELFRIGASKGCQKCAQQILSFLNMKPSILKDQKEETGSISSKQQSQKKILSQVKDSSYQDRFKKQSQNKSQFSNPYFESELTSVPERTRNTISNYNYKQQNETKQEKKDLRMRFASDYTGIQGMSQSILLSQLKLQVQSPGNTPITQYNNFGSPRRTLLSPTNNSASRKDLLQFSRNSSQSSLKYMLNQ